MLRFLFLEGLFQRCRPLEKALVNLLIHLEQVVLRVLIHILRDYVKQAIVVLVCHGQFGVAEADRDRNLHSLLQLQNKNLLIELEHLVERVDEEWALEQSQLDEQVQLLMNALLLNFLKLVLEHVSCTNPPQLLGCLICLLLI